MVSTTTIRSWSSFFHLFFCRSVSHMYELCCYSRLICFRFDLQWEVEWWSAEKLKLPVGWNSFARGS
jgi:hypothetical protein